MFSDTHFHFNMLCQGDAQKGSEILRQMAERDVFFGMDIGTKCGDLVERQTFAASAISAMAGDTRDKAEKFLHFSAGIWPSAESIKNRDAEISSLRQTIENSLKQKIVRNYKIAAIGECGLDHHWNKAGVDGRNEADFDKSILTGEAEMFEAQLEMAREMQLPIVIHSRDAFDGTYSCIKNVGYDCGIIHCFSYGAKEAKAFAERGWHISFSGSVTYTKKSKLDEIAETVRCVPQDLILLETDSPYLSPVPLRGQQNTPLNVVHTYEYVANILGITTEQLCSIADENCKKLFGVE